MDRDYATNNYFDTFTSWRVAMSQKTQGYQDYIDTLISSYKWGLRTKPEETSIPVPSVELVDFLNSFSVHTEEVCQHG